MQGGDKLRLATKAAILIGETLDLMGLPLEILGFTTAEYEAKAAMKLGLRPAHAYRTTRCSPLEHRIYKRFDEPYPIVRRRLTGIEPRHNNWDEEHLLFAFRRLQTRRERSKVMIVISDGQPNGDANHLIATVTALEAQGCKVIGVGIGADFVRQVYRKALVVDGFRRLAEELLGVLAAELGRADRAASGAWPAKRAAA
jgi:cobalamin biosynthesis protein CobT